MGLFSRVFMRLIRENIERRFYMLPHPECLSKRQSYDFFYLVACDIPKK